jgi:hypothetical protein
VIPETIERTFRKIIENAVAAPLSLPAAGTKFASDHNGVTKEISAMSVPRYAYPRDTHEFEKKLKHHHPGRSLVMNLVGFFTVVGVVGIALMVAFSPGMSLYPAVRALFHHS